MDKKKIEIIIVIVGAAVLLFFGKDSLMKIFHSTTPIKTAGVNQAKTAIDLLAPKGVPVKKEEAKAGKLEWGRDPFVLKETTDKGVVNALVLMGITMGARPMAAINDEMVGIGSSIGGYKVIKITNSEVVLNDGAKDLVLTME